MPPEYEDQTEDQELEYEDEDDGGIEEYLEYLASQNEELNAQNLQFQNNVAQQIEQLRMQFQRPEATQPRVEDSYNNLLYTDPDKFVNAMRQDITSELEERYSQAQAAQQSQQAYERFWQDFARRYPELEDDIDVGEALLSRHFNELSPLSTSDAMDAIADMVAERMGYEFVDDDDDADDDYVETHSGNGASQPRGQQAQSTSHPQGGLAEAISAYRQQHKIR